MADIPINPVTRRVEFTGNTGTGPFAFTFNVLAQADIAAYKNNTLLALTSDYTVSLNSNGTGSITLVAALIASDELVIIGDLPLSRTTDFVTAGDLLASSLNQQFDSNVVMSQQLDERFDRTIRSQPGDINKNLYLPLVSSRASQLLSFDSSGNITTTSLANVPDIGTVNLSVSGVASFADGSASAPSITNIGDTNTGMYFGAADQINFSIGGSEVISVASTGTTISGLSISSGDILLTDNSATALEIKEGSNNYLTFITTNGSEKLSFGSTANPTFEVNGSFRQPLIAATTSFFSQTYSGATLSATNGSVNIESYSASKAGIVLNGSGDQITFTSPTLGFVGLVQVVGAITTDTSLNIASSTTVDGILDEDDMASNSETKLATQQSIKAYVDAQVGTVDTLAEVLANGNTTGSNNIIVTAGQSITVDTISETTAANGVVIDGVTLKDGGATVTADVSFGDNDKAIFGAGPELQIYSDGTSGIIKDVGAGDIKILADDFYVQNAAGNSTLISVLDTGKVGLGFAGSEKLATTSTGIDVTGTVTADGLTVDGDVNIDDAVPILRLDSPATTWAGGEDLGGLDWYTKDTSGSGPAVMARIYSENSGANTLPIPNMIFQTSVADVSLKDRMKIAGNGDISFYENTGTTAKFFWDADAESLGIGTTSPTAPLTIGYSGAEAQIQVNNSGGNRMVYLGAFSENEGILRLFNSSNVETVRIPSESTAGVHTYFNAGNVGIGTSSPNQNLQVKSSSGGGLTLQADTSTQNEYSQLGFVSSTNDAANPNAYIRGLRGSTSTATFLTFGTSNTERMRIDSSGHAIIPAGVTLGTAAGVYNAANTLDDYEEGTWTVALTPSTSGTISLDSGGGAFYTKIGQVVHISISVGNNSSSSPVGYIGFNLPFAAASGFQKGRSALALYFDGVAGSNVADFIGLTIDGTSEGRIYLGDNPVTQSDSAQQMDGSCYILISGSYITSA